MTRGEVFFASVDHPNNSHIQKGLRPWVVVQNDMANKYSPVITVIPLTSNLHKKPNLPTHCYVYPDGLGMHKSLALCEQITTIDKLPCYVVRCKLSAYDMENIDHCLKIALGLEVL